MDWERVVEGNAKRLRRILAALVAMAGLTISQSPPLRGRCPAGQRGVDTETLDDPPLSAEPVLGLAEGQTRGPTSPPQGGRLELPRRLHRAILRQLRPLESATRRLIIVAARGLPVPALPASGITPASPALPAKPASLTGSRIVSIDLGLAGCAPPPPPPPRAVRRTWSLPVADPLKRFGPRRKYVPAHAAPRIIFFDGSIPHRLPPPPGPHDQIDATRLALRLAGIGRALVDLPAQTQRYVRWKARSDARRVGRVIVPRSPLRPGRAPGWRVRSKDEINEVLADMQYFAREVLRKPDTS